jgi:hypothetical protein
MQTFIDLPTAAKDELSIPLASTGFTLMDSELHRVSYRRDDVVIQFEIYPEDAVPRPLNVALGLVTSDGSMRGVGAWELIPADAEARRYSMWRFIDQVGLRTTLRRVYVDVVEKWLTVYLEAPRRLEQVIDARKQSRETSYDVDQVQRLLHVAREAFDVGRYQTALDSYAVAGVALGPVDLKRQEISRRKVMHS